jgi:type I restriction enzyme, S subunit
MFSKGTIVIAITGATIGVTGILDIDACFPDSIVGINAPPENILPEFLYWAIEHTKQLALAQATQTTQPNINLRILDTIIIPIPPLDEQRRIVAYLDGLQAKVNALREYQSASGEELSAMMPSVLDKAFKGEL